MSENNVDNVDMIEAFKKAAEARIVALSTEVSSYEAKLKAAKAEALRLSVAINTIGSSAIPKKKSRAKKARRAKHQHGGRLAAMTHAAQLNEFMLRDLPEIVRSHVAASAQFGLLDVVRKERLSDSIQAVNVYRISDKGRAWLAARAGGGAS